MNFTGNIKNISIDWISKRPSITFELNEINAADNLEKLKDSKIKLKVEKYRKSRSISANAMLWACLGEIAAALNADKWEIYLQMLKRYGKYTYVCVKPNAVEAVKAQWREVEDVGNIQINGETAVQLLCYFGSHTYDSKEFSVLLEGVIYEMKEIGLTPPPTQEMRRALEEMEKNEKHNTRK